MPLNSNTFSGDKVALQAAIEAWRSARPGQGNEQFYLLVVELARLGMTPEAIKETLLHEASFGRSPAERREQISSILRGLSKRKRAA